MTESERIARAYRSRSAGVASRWDLANAGNRAILAERRNLVRRVLDDQGWLPLGERRLLDVGAGGGAELAWFTELGAVEANLAGIDLLPERVESARRRFPAIDFQVGNAERLPFPDASFDILVAYTLFSSILDGAMARAVAAEMTRVMKPGGGLLWYDFRYDSPSNHDVRGVPASRVRDLFPTLRGGFVRLTLLPPLARRLGPLTGIGYRALSTLTFLRSHLLALLVKPA
ncbi:MAG TPA: class I SAM-dependent methyltransferase [Candidatus Dormibacteraeota bacterium]|nr:class I SAM-dependent methyltransferase [Candidatus Dormibacteraeota bacterium]